MPPYHSSSGPGRSSCSTRLTPGSGVRAPFGAHVFGSRSGRPEALPAEYRPPHGLPPSSGLRHLRACASTQPDRLRETVGQSATVSTSARRRRLVEPPPLPSVLSRAPKRPFADVRSVRPFPAYSCHFTRKESDNSGTEPRKPQSFDRASAVLQRRRLIGRPLVRCPSDATCQPLQLQPCENRIHRVKLRRSSVDMWNPGHY